MKETLVKGKFLQKIQGSLRTEHIFKERGITARRHVLKSFRWKVLSGSPSQIPCAIQLNAISSFIKAFI